MLFLVSFSVVTLGELGGSSAEADLQEQWFKRSSIACDKMTFHVFYLNLNHCSSKSARHIHAQTLMTKFEERECSAGWSDVVGVCDEALVYSRACWRAGLVGVGMANGSWWG